MPIPIQKTFTYSVTDEEYNFLKKGMRVAVSFGKTKLFTGLVFNIHQKAPILYEAKDIHQILDDKPLVNEHQLKHWQWIANYYICALGDVFRASLPSAFLLESETIVYKNEAFINENELEDDEFLIFEALQHQSQLTIHQVADILGKKKVMPIVNELIKKSAIYIQEKIYEQYKPKLVKYVRLHSDYTSDDSLNSLLEDLSRAKKQRVAVLTFFQLSTSKKPIKAKDLETTANVSSAVLKSLVDKNIFEFYEIQTDRINFKGDTNTLKTLNEFQEKAYSEIKETFTKKDVTLLHGITSSGKTEIYTKLIQEVLDDGKQVLFLLPEIALTTQIITRLQFYFGEQISVFHSKYSMNERVEVWNNVLENKTKAQIILGARSSIFLPFSNLGLIVVDEEHETSYKQFEPSPRYNARDAAIVLSKMHQAKILLGSATPSLESYFNAQQNKYGFVVLNRRFNNVQLPKIELIDVKEKHKKKEMKGHFSDRLLKLIQEALDEKEQVILFQNRRGYSPIVECKTCGVAPQCPNCDVSLTFHKFRHELRCHYCSYQRAMPNSCSACGSNTLDTKGFGTEQIELELKELFPDYKIGRMDLDTTRGKFGYQKIIGAFEAREIDVLVGTQMLSKGLDFDNVTLVGILNADTMLNFPDFRAHERAYQMMVQVSGRAGRNKKQGNVAIQTYNPYHQILQQVSTTNYTEMYKEQLQERWQFKYPPYYRLIKITLKHRDYNKVDSGVNWLFKALYASFGEHVLGPTAPAVSRIRNQYIKNIVIKIPPKQSLANTKNQVAKIKNTFEAVKDFRPIRFIMDVDAY
ncbi:primosomal protein N' [Polaribacter reichenbachii]|uniref:Replication restart protein PriA n=1 Tax=Polaribacter reichenbachii TaxID=996801 RepID=A0A1B8U5C5_9FLAO|nr:primosomal protein N' [Polaribacter reichenbachii]APZ47591.1 primosomal protein N' [Polaribacter reichenbachii]AUC18231.1 primosomal protein N' [Polaribacter reichenbachii]OBY67057.1 primosomal protein N' [Polaribacter reichenbachii]